MSPFANDAGCAGESPIATNGVVFAQVTTANGYRMEFKFPWSTLGATPMVGNFIGLEVQVNDDDDRNAEGRPQRREQRGDRFDAARRCADDDRVESGRAQHLR